MNLTYLIVLTILIIILIISLIKRLIKIALVVGLTIILYNAIFIWTGDEVISNLRMNEYLHKRDINSIERFYKEYRNREKNIYGE